MSLTSILSSAGAALTTAQYQIAVSQTNVANADDASYSRKTVSTTATTQTLAVSTATVTRAADAYLAKAVDKTAAVDGRDAVIDTYMQSYDASLGSVDGGDDVSSLLTAFQTALTSLASSSTTATKASAVSAASSLASSIQSLSDEIQSLRSQANLQIGETVDTINSTLETIQALNDQIVSTTASGGDVSDLEDRRAAAVTTLSSLMGVSTYKTSDNRVVVYTSGGEQLLGASVAKLSYEASSSLSASAVYPGAIAGVTVNGKDITTSLTGGKLGGLVSLRDDILVGEQDALDQLTSTLIDLVNTAANSGSASPPPNSLTSSETVSGTDAFSATGSVRVAVTNSSGAVVSTVDIDLSAYATVDDLVAGLNSVSGLSASISNGKLTIAATSSGNGVALADIDASVGGDGFSAYFGFNDIFSGDSAVDIAVASGLTTDPSRFPTATMDVSGALAVGQIGVASGDTGAASAISSALSSSTSFTAAGNLTAGQSSLIAYAGSFVSTAATTIADAASQAETSGDAHDAAVSRLANLTTVNLDEELAMLEVYQQVYQANAQLTSIVQELFDTLINMVN
ncbi:flagellar hook-associated protein FlgK [Caulobacter sp. BP25]|uniref:flagellar hook-associated protein FlgK n=1 Tax=Caulobacter sp. BP25 TaxID=2048900 RepID=UPI000C12CEF3|nr:flagellar hook-associated protein FlgK [Caulobacter sp. BP25]PHY18841.1 flagellar hook-associated protein FlgK [Caulobacter sp. BP25]